MPLFLVLFTIIAVKFSHLIKKYFNVVCIILTAISISVYLTQNMRSPINSGKIGIALLILVMFQSAFKKKSILYKKLLLVRKEYSILGFIFIVPHALLYTIGDFQNLEWNGILSFLIMVPLFATSFIFIRKKMKVKHWKALHIASYPAYALMFAHVIFVGLPTVKVMYSVIALIYVVLKLRNDNSSRLNKRYYKLITSVFMLTLIAVNVYFYNASNTFYDLESLTLEDGIYSGEATGFTGMKVKVDVLILENEITEIDILEYRSSEPDDGVNFVEAIEEVRDNILDKQSTNVDVISGATRVQLDSRRL